MIVITGSRGYIGTATRELLEKDGHNILEIDKKLGRDTRYIFSYLTGEKPKCIIHLSAKKSIPESKKKPWAYYFNNILSTLSVAIVSRVASIPVVFASSAAVYSPSNPYARGKIWEERLLWLLCPKLAVLRYFNVVGKSETIKDDSTNIFSIIGRESKININNTTSTRDYVHVMDIARSNILAMQYLETNDKIITDIFTGKQRTIMQIIQEYDKIGHKIEYTVLDIPDVSISPVIDNRSKIGWKPKYTFSQAVKSEIRRNK